MARGTDLIKTYTPSLIEAIFLDVTAQRVFQSSTALRRPVGARLTWQRVRARLGTSPIYWQSTERMATLALEEFFGGASWARPHRLMRDLQASTRGGGRVVFRSTWSSPAAQSTSLRGDGA